MGTGYLGGFGRTSGEKNNETTILIAELRKNGVKFTEKDIIFITRDKSGRIMWLEKGKSSAGLEHILSRHIADFEKAFGISKVEIPSFLERVISNGEIVSNTLIKRNGFWGYERIYYYNGNYCLLTGVGTNGFIVTAYPVEY